MKRFAFPRTMRLSRRRDFRRVMTAGRRASDHAVIVCVDRNGLPHLRLGLSVSRRLGRAVVRNRVKRLLREAFRLEAPHLPGGLDIVCIPRSVRTAELATYRQSLARLVPKAAARLPTTPGCPPAPS